MDSIDENPTVEDSSLDSSTSPAAEPSATFAETESSLAAQDSTDNGFSTFMDKVPYKGAISTVAVGMGAAGLFALLRRR